MKNDGFKTLFIVLHNLFIILNMASIPHNAYLGLSF